MLTKICTSCGIEKEATTENFNTHPNSKYGLSPKCKICRKAYRASVRERTKEYNKNYYVTNIEQCRQYHINYKNSGITAIRYELNRERILNKNRKYSKEYRQTPIGKLIGRMHCNNRRARLRGLENSLSREQWNTCKDYFKQKCAYCGRKRKLEQEHFIPLSKQGEFSIKNIIPSCKYCNARKTDKDFFEWYPTYEYYSKTREKRLLNYLNYKDKHQQLALTI